MRKSGKSRSAWSARGAARNATGDRCRGVHGGIRRLSGRSVLCEQTPRNIYYASISWRPSGGKGRARNRDPRAAVLASQKRRYRVRGNSAAETCRPRRSCTWGSTTTRSTMVRLWLSATGEALSLEGHPASSLIRYEDLVGAPKPPSARCATRSGCVEPGTQTCRTGVRPRTSTGVVRPVLCGARKWREILDDAEIGYCERRTAAERARFGYRTPKQAAAACRSGPCSQPARRCTWPATADQPQRRPSSSRRCSHRRATLRNRS